MTIRTANLGFPRIGKQRELKFALEAYWSGKADPTTLLDVAARLRADHWQLQKESGIDIIPSNDFSLYDHVLDTAVMVGAVPRRFGALNHGAELDTYFAMARGSSEGNHGDCGHSDHRGQGRAPLEMTKWFDTNYHYVVPELSDDQLFRLASTKPVDHFLEAKKLGIHTRPVILGPVSFLKLSKSPDAGFNPLALLPRLLPVYEELLTRLHDAGADWVQIDEPALVLDLIPNERAAFNLAYRQLGVAAGNLKIMLASYFGSLGKNLSTTVELPVAGIHIDLVRAPNELRAILDVAWSGGKIVSLGAVDYAMSGALT